jgi:hypothetical protein
VSTDDMLDMARHNADWAAAAAPPAAAGAAQAAWRRQVYALRRPVQTCSACQYSSSAPVCSAPGDCEALSAKGNSSSCRPVVCCAQFRSTLCLYCVLVAGGSGGSGYVAAADLQRLQAMFANSCRTCLECYSGSICCFTVACNTSLEVYPAWASCTARSNDQQPAPHARHAQTINSLHHVLM